MAAYEDSESDLLWDGVSQLVSESLTLVRRDIEQELRTSRPGFDGVTYNPALDEARLESQMGRVFECLRSGEWYTPTEMSAITGDNWSSVNARIRDLRKAKFGAWIVDRVRDPNNRGLHRYRLRNPDGTEVPPLRPLQLGATIERDD